MTPVRLQTVAVLLVLAAVVVAERVHTAAEPLERDVAGYAVIGHEMGRGRHLYTDLWERKPPLLYATFAAAEKVVGYGPAEVLVVNVAAALTTLAGCYAAGRAVGGTAGGLVAAALWALVGGDPWLQANQPNGEAFVNAALTAAAAVLVTPGPAGRRRGVAVGVGFTLATLYEQHVLVTCATLAVGYVMADRRDARRRSAAMAVAAAVGAIAWGGTAAYFAAVGRLSAATDVLFHQLFHGVSLTANLAAALHPERLVPSTLYWAVIPAALVLLAAVIGRPAPVRPDRPWLVWAGWSVGTWVVVALPGTFFDHYYQCWIPPLCVAGGWAAGRLWGPLRGPLAVRPVAVVAALAAVAWRELPPYRWTPDEWSARKYPLDNFIEQAALSRRLLTVLRPDEQFWVLGSDNTFYFATGRSPVTGQLFFEPLIDDPHTTGWARVVADLDRVRPPLILMRVSLLPWMPAGTPLVPFVRDHYERVDTDLYGRSYTVWVRRGDADFRRRLLGPPGHDGGS